MIAKRLLLCLFFVAGVAEPDGGAVVFTATSHSVIFTVFVSPSPVRVGQADLSVLLQRESDRTPILGAQVTAKLTKSGLDAIDLPLTHAAATDKLLYAGSVDFPERGTYKVEIDARSAQATGWLVVLPEQAPVLTYWPYFAVIPVAICLFWLNRYLKGKRQGASAFS